MKALLLVAAILLSGNPLTRYESRHDPWIYVSKWDTGFCPGVRSGYGWTGRLDWPTDYREIEQGRGFSANHQGIDALAEMGSPITAAATGRVIWSGYSTIGYGNLIILDHGGWRTYYAHLDSVDVKCGQFIRRGQIIGYAGTSGASSFEHLHFEVRRGDWNYDPTAFFR